MLIFIPPFRFKIIITLHDLQCYIYSENFSALYDLDFDIDTLFFVLFSKLSWALSDKVKSDLFHVEHFQENL